MDTLRAYLSTLSTPAQLDYAYRAGTTIGYLRKALSKGQRFDGALARRLDEQSGGAVSRLELRPDIFGDVAGHPVGLAVQVDTRMSKRALRARLGLSTDTQLAKVLQLPADQVEAWEEERALPAVPEVLRLLGAQAPAASTPQEPEDLDAARIVPVETA
ncbi:hypothetical protein [Stenotrophomonas nitritireducens]|uniref:hypothetical protein n=1 Tax=Stenotrophomonas nitritireducens TaxID=83617 RepID=UPI0023547572|nr:hypothetical protein [Stenotrophomonas nitritireducens]